MLFTHYLLQILYPVFGSRIMILLNHKYNCGVGKMIDTIFSIGYSGFTIDDFVSTLMSNNITLLVDVRSQPYSRIYADYNKEILEAKLTSNGIYYRNFSKEFGAKQENRAFFSKEGYLDFDMFSKSKEFQDGFKRLEKSLASGYRIALMCAEKDPFNCHRTILVSRTFHDAGYKVIHLLPGSRSILQEDIEDRLLKKYFPDRNQLTLFGNTQTESELIKLAYRKRNEEIGYTIEEESE